MFAGAIGPGLLLVLAYTGIVFWRARGLPALAPEDRTSLGRMALDLGPLLILVISVLGSIIAGHATPTQASGLGAFGAVLITLLYRRFSFSMLMEASRKTVVTTSMALFAMIGATCFAAVFKGIGGDDLVEAGVTLFGDGPFTVLIVVMGVLFVLGSVLD